MGRQGEQWSGKYTIESVDDQKVIRVILNAALWRVFVSNGLASN